jgi:hypothetical protein
MTFAARHVSQIRRSQSFETDHKVSLYKIQLVRKTLLCSISSGSLDLVVIVVESSDLGSGELGNLSSWTAHTTADIEDFHAIPD